MRRWIVWCVPTIRSADLELEPQWVTVFAAGRNHAKTVAVRKLQDKWMLNQHRVTRWTAHEVRAD